MLTINLLLAALDPPIKRYHRKLAECLWKEEIDETLGDPTTQREIDRDEFYRQLDAQERRDTFFSLLRRELKARELREQIGDFNVLAQVLGECMTPQELAEFVKEAAEHLQNGQDEFYNQMTTIYGHAFQMNIPVQPPIEVFKLLQSTPYTSKQFGVPNLMRKEKV